MKAKKRRLRQREIEFDNGHYTLQKKKNKLGS